LLGDRTLPVGALDADRPGLLLLGELALEIDAQHTLGKARTHDLDVVGELEAPLEVTAGDAAIEIFLVLGRRMALAADKQLVFLLRDVSSASVKPATAMTMR